MASQPHQTKHANVYLQDETPWNTLLVHHNGSPGMYNILRTPMFTYWRKRHYRPSQCITMVWTRQPHRQGRPVNHTVRVVRDLNLVVRPALIQSSINHIKYTTSSHTSKHLWMFNLDELKITRWSHNNIFQHNKFLSHT